MKKQLTLFMLACASAACQPQATSNTTATAAPGAPVVQRVAAAKAAPLRPAPLSLADTLSPATRAMLRQVNLAKLLLAPEPGQAADYQTVLDGFFGRDPQRLSLAILKATRDSLNPGLFHIAGRTRYKKQVTDFTGSIQLTSVADYYDQGLLRTQGEESFIQDTTAAGSGDILNARAYSAAAAFLFTSRPPAAYSLSGRAMLDFWVTDKGKIGGLYAPCEGCVEDKAASKGSSLLFRGNWLNTSNKKGRNFIVCRSVFAIANDLIKDFGIGDRGAQVNPKYDKLGWSDYWENEEWHADSPKPRLSM